MGLRSNDLEWSVEELIAMQFAYVKELAESVAEDTVLDVVVTVSGYHPLIGEGTYDVQVPPFYSQFERQAVLDAVELSGLRPISLINDGTAGA